MEAKNFRIGNLIKRNNDVFEIWDLKRKELELDSKELDRHVNFETYDNIEPLVLDDKWLNNFGFKQYFASYHDAHFIYTNGVMNIEYKYDYVWVNGIEIKEMKFVHQLQNLFFAITGQELELKDKSK